MFAHAGLILALTVVAFAVAKALKWSTELAMLLAAVVGAVAHGVWFPARHVVEGAFTYFDVVLIFLTAALFMNLFKESGGVAYIVRGILTRFHKNRFLLLVLLTFILLIPGALTGAGSVTVLILGAPIGTVLSYLGIPKARVAGIIFLCAAMGAAAPPVNLWAMMTAAGANMPYVGFTLPLAVISITGALFSMFFLGWRGKAVAVDQALRELPEPPAGMSGWRVALPFAVFLAVVVAGRVWPFQMPVVGLPLAFLLSAATTVLVSPVRLRVLEISHQTVEALLPLVGTLTVVGILVQSMALTGARGLISLSVVTLPLAAILTTLFLVLPLSEGVLQYGAAPLLGVPLILLFNMKGINTIIALAGMATIWPLGDSLPPTALVGRAVAMTVGYDGPYYRGFLKTILVPSLVIAALGTLYVIYSKSLAFLVWG
ncbi:MAG: hypothetical protein ACM3RP_09035 [Chitinophagales bacterium]